MYGENGRSVVMESFGSCSDCVLNVLGSMIHDGSSRNPPTVFRDQHADSWEPMRTPRVR